MDRPTRTRARFTLPDHDDARVHRVVEGFLSQPRLAVHPGRGRSRSDAADPLAALVPRVDWAVELASEERRRARYGRPASVAVVELRSGPDAERLAVLAARVLRRETRDADRVTRVAPRRFHVLLPETRERGASVFAQRLQAAWATATRAAAPDVPLVVRVAGTSDAETVPEALQRAIRLLV
jgi:hypothetical protein